MSVLCYNVAAHRTDVSMLCLAITNDPAVYIWVMNRSWHVLMASFNTLLMHPLVDAQEIE